MARLATPAVLALLVFLSLLAPSAAIQVAPNSPCASLCINDASLDVSDPNSSTTTNADIVCADADFGRTAAGKKWTACMGCLQNSTHVQGSESDQAWFFYNLRYNIDYCIFGYPNATDVIGSNPCQTSTACGPLEKALFDGIPTMGGLAEYAYCDVDGGALAGASFKGCFNCISAGGETNIVANCRSP